MNCVCYTNPNFQPSIRVISAITNSNPAIVTTTNPHKYFDNMFVRLNIPRACGMLQADKLTGYITITGVDTFTINIDTTGFDAFSIPVAPNPHDNICALVVPIGEKYDTTAGVMQNVLG